MKNKAGIFVNKSVDADWINNIILVVSVLLVNVRDRSLAAIYNSFVKTKHKIVEIFNTIKSTVSTILTKCLRTPTGKNTALVVLSVVGTLVLTGYNFSQHTELLSLQDATSSEYPATKKFTKDETRILILAYEIGAQVTKHPETIQAILLQETHAGRYGNRVGDSHLPVGKRSYGLMQVKVGTARRVLKTYPELTLEYFTGRNESKVHDEEIIAKLITDDEFSIKVGALNFVIEKRITKNWARAVVAYNAGTRNGLRMRDPEAFEYTQRVLRHIEKTVKPFNRQMGLVTA